MSDSRQAVFLSYASQDADAARRICEALRSAGVEVWFDAEGGLEHGDEWDAKIRRQIKECILFIPIISANTQAREEGYFRIEWDLAAERARGIASGVPFILPVVIDDTREPDALVPDRFRAVQWMRLPGGVVTPEARARYLKVWSHRVGAVKHVTGAPAASAPASTREFEPRALPDRPPRRIATAAWVGAAIACAGVAVFAFLRPKESVPGVAVRAEPVSPVSEARQLARRARALIDALDSSRNDYRLAEDLIGQARTKDATDAEVSAIEAQVHQRFIQRGWDPSDARREAARVAAQRAIRLDPQSFEARYAQVNLLGYTGRDGEERERQLRELRRERPTDQRVLRGLATVLDRLGRLEESAAIVRESAALPGGDPLALYNLSHAYWFAGRASDAEAMIEASLAQRPFAGALLMNVWYKTTLRGDIERARQAIEQIEPTQMLEDRAAYFAYYTEWLGRSPRRAIGWLQAVPRDWLNDSWYRGPKGLLVGDAHELAGRREAAAIEWQAALKLVEQRLADRPRDVPLLATRVQLLAKLGQRDEAVRQFTAATQVAGIDPTSVTAAPVWVTNCCVVLDRKADAIRQIGAALHRQDFAVNYPAAVLRLDPLFDPLRHEPDFAKVIAEAEVLEKSGTAAPADRRGDAPGPKAKSIAVLAFRNLSDEKDNDIFSDGISDELTNVLGRVPGLRVAGSTSAFSFKGKSATAQEIGQKLGVGYIVDGTVRKANGRVRISAKLINAADGFQIWASENLDRELKDVWAVQDEIVGVIAHNLKLKLGGAARPAQSVNPEAHRLVLEGRHFWNLRTEVDLKRSEEKFTKAIEIDPQFAAAHAGLADASVIIALYWGADGVDQVQGYLARGRTAALRAQELDPLLPEPLGALAYAAAIEGDLAGADRYILRAIALNPNHATAHQWRGVFLARMGRLDEALQEFDLGVQLDPLSFIHQWVLGEGLAFGGRNAQALEVFERAATLRSTLFIPQLAERALAELKAGRHADAVAAARQIRASWPTKPRWWGDGYAVWILREAGQVGEAEGYAKDILEKLPPASYQRGVVLAACDRFDEALPFLERTPHIARRILFWAGLFDRYRGDARFERLMTTLECLDDYRVARETQARVLGGAIQKK